MRLAIISDIHANLAALEAVLDDVSATAAEEIWCLGDVVGYGAQPDECAELVADRCAICLVGNHDLAVLGELDTSTFSPAAAAAVRWTQGAMDGATVDFLAALKPANEALDVALYHASPRDPVWEYVLWPDQAAECIHVQARRVSFIGHSHVALYFAADEEDPGEGPLQASGAQAGAGTELDLDSGRWLVNPGSVGQPRDGDPRGAWALLDAGAWRLVYRRTEYDVAAAAAAIRAARLPDSLAERLQYGQ